VQYAWLIDPLQQTLEVFQTDGMHWVGIASYQGENAIRAIPFEAIELPLSALWLPSA
jgi:Uma2 family endonuclease